MADLSGPVGDTQPDSLADENGAVIDSPTAFSSRGAVGPSTKGVPMTSDVSPVDRLNEIRDGWAAGRPTTGLELLARAGSDVGWLLEHIEQLQRESDAEHCWTQDPADHKGYYDQVRIVLAAADECDRVAGVVRVDTNDLATLERIVYALRYTNWYRGDSVEAAGAVLTAIREIAAARAQPPPEEEQR